MEQTINIDKIKANFRNNQPEMIGYSLIQVTRANYYLIAPPKNQYYFYYPKSLKQLKQKGLKPKQLPFKNDHYFQIQVKNMHLNKLLRILTDLEIQDSEFCIFKYSLWKGKIEEKEEENQNLQGKKQLQNCTRTYNDQEIKKVNFPLFSDASSDINESESTHFDKQNSPVKVEEKRENWFKIQSELKEIGNKKENIVFQLEEVDIEISDLEQQLEEKLNKLQQQDKNLQDLKSKYADINQKQTALCLNTEEILLK